MINIKNYNDFTNEELEQNFDNIFYVYCFVDTRKPGKYIFEDFEFNYEPIYIGKGKGIRAKRHFTLYKRYNTRFYSKLNSIIDDGYYPDIIYIKNEISEKVAFEYEKYFIKLIGRIENGGSLTNLTDGGEGQSGFKFSDESRKKMSISHSGERHYNYGKTMLDGQKIKISLSKMGSISTMKGKHHTEEAKIKMSEKAKERIGDKNSMYGKKHSEESKEKMSKNRIPLYGEDNGNYGREYKEEEKTFDTWELTDNENNITVIDNLNKFCRDHGYNANCMMDVYSGRSKTHKKWIKVNKLTNNVKKKKAI